MSVFSQTFDTNMFILNAQKYSALLVPRETIELPPFNGSTFRGAFGYLLKEIVCIHTLNSMRKCNQCIINQSCQYTSIFETGVQDRIYAPDMVTNYAPHPFIFEPPLSMKSRIYYPDETIPINIILIGEPKRLIPYFIYTFEKMGDTGIGPERKKFSLQSVWIEEKNNKKIIYTAEKKILDGNYTITDLSENLSFSEKITDLCIMLETPMRIKYKGRYIRKLTFPVFIRSVLRRITTLAQAYGKYGISSDDVYRLLEKSKKIQTTVQQTSWIDYQRFSTRQKQKMILGGIVGKVVFSGELTPFIPLLKTAEILHVGKNTSFGLGKITLHMKSGD